MCLIYVSSYACAHISCRNCRTARPPAQKKKMYIQWHADTYVVGMENMYIAACKQASGRQASCYTYVVGMENIYIAACKQASAR